MRIDVIALVGLTALMSQAPFARAQAAAPPERDQDIRLIRGNVYGVRDGREHTVFLVTSDGILLVDPLSRPAAAALKLQLESRFPDRPVRYIVFTHHHSDRTTGGGIFDKAQFVAHRSYSEELARSRRANDAEYRFVRDVSRDTFDQTRTITLGGATVRLAHVRSRHAAEMAVVYFPDEKLLFAAAPPSVTSVPFSFGILRPKEVFEWIDVVTELNPDTLLFDDGTTMEGAALRQLAEYLRAVRSDVAYAYERGRTLQDVQSAGVPAAHKDVPHYAARDAHSGLVYRSLRLVRVELTGRAIANYTARDDSALCDNSLSLCSSGGALPGGSGGMAVTVGTRFGAVAEGTLMQQYWASRASPGFQEETALRLSRLSLLFRYGAPRPGGFSYMPVVGISHTTGHVRGLSHVTGVLVPIGGYHSIEDRATRMGLTLGVDLVRTTNRGFSISAPIRVTRISGEQPAYWPATVDVQAGIGVSIPVVRRIGLR